MRNWLIIGMLWSGLTIASPDPKSSPTPSSEPGTYELTSISALRDAPDGRIAAVWDAGARFTSADAAGNWLRVTGHFPGAKWEPLRPTLWIRNEYALPIQPQRPAPRSPEQRYLVVNKSDFRLEVFEKREAGDVTIFSTQVALGMDRCLPASKGGRCYYTEPGEYQVRWKVHDPDGIEWCIPKSMEAEYAEDIARGQRCFRGSIGKHALNIGKSYAIHGTSNPASIGRRVSHGCVRTRNRDMETLYTLMDVGDKVYIVEGEKERTRLLQTASVGASGQD